MGNLPPWHALPQVTHRTWRKTQGFRPRIPSARACSGLRPNLGLTTKQVLRCPKPVFREGRGARCSFLTPPTPPLTPIPPPPRLPTPPSPRKAPSLLWPLGLVRIRLPLGLHSHPGQRHQYRAHRAGPRRHPRRKHRGYGHGAIRVLVRSLDLGIIVLLHGWRASAQDVLYLVPIF